MDERENLNFWTVYIWWSHIAIFIIGIWPTLLFLVPSNTKLCLYLVESKPNNLASQLQSQLLLVVHCSSYVKKKKKKLIHVFTHLCIIHVFTLFCIIIHLFTLYCSSFTCSHYNSYKINIYYFTVLFILF